VDLKSCQGWRFAEKRFPKREYSRIISKGKNKKKEKVGLSCLGLSKRLKKMVVLLSRSNRDRGKERSKGVS